MLALLRNFLNNANIKKKHKAKNYILIYNKKKKFGIKQVKYNIIMI